MKIKTIIVEDESLGQDALSGILNNFCSETVELVAITGTVKDSIAAINKHNPKLVLLDIKLGANDNGAFDILEAVEKLDFKVVFTTSSELPVHILKALNEYGAKKYLLKPLDIEEVVQAVNESISEINNNVVDELENIKSMLSGIKSQEIETKLQLPVRHGFQYIKHEDIVMLRANQNSTVVFMCNDESLISSKNLRYFEINLPDPPFIRVSRSFIINVNHVERYCNEDGGTVYLKNDCSATLSGGYSKRFFNGINF